MTSVTVPSRGARVPVVVVLATLVATLAALLRKARAAGGVAQLALDLAGLALIVVGAFQLATWLGWMAAGAALLVLSASVPRG